MENKIKNILNDLNIPINIKGYWYYIQTVKYCISKKITNINLSKDVYIAIAEENNVLPSSVERALRVAIEDKKEKIQSYFGINYKITNSVFLKLLLNELKYADELES